MNICGLNNLEADKEAIKKFNATCELIILMSQFDVNILDMGGEVGVECIKDWEQFVSAYISIHERLGIHVNTVDYHGLMIVLMKK